ncbi:MAG: CotH kinase family protein [Clostridiaceae bacterium]|nr:CotH kinase family protein [Clostridiaceae bacterium]
MSKHRNIDKICCAAIAIALIITFVILNAGLFGITQAETSMGYESKLFDTSYVHTINIVMDDWNTFIESCEDEEYASCAVVIDNESYKNVGIRAKGNTSLSSVSAYGNDRYSFKIEFDQYDSTKSYYGLDKISLNNIVQDNTYMKDFLTYQMMGYFEVSSPLCSYVYITVNGEDWGLYLAVESAEESFLERNYGSDYGELYKPDSTGMGGGRGNGGGFDMDEFRQDTEDVDQTTQSASTETHNQEVHTQIQDSGQAADSGNMPQDPDSTTDTIGTTRQRSSLGRNNQGGGGQVGGFGGGTGNSDVSLIYTDDDCDSYSNIFNNAKTDISDSDKDRLIAALKALNEGEDIEDTVDVEAVIRYFVVHNFVCNFDSYTGSMIHNYYLYEEDGQLSMIPWDYNLAFGGFMSGSDSTTIVNYPIDSPVSSGEVSSRPMIAWIFASEEYTELYHQYFAEFICEYFDSGEFETMIASVTEMIAPYVEKDPTKFCTYEEFESGAAALKDFCLLRAESITGQLAGTIPSTSDGQSADSSTLIDASAVSISDMGSMGGGGNMGDRPTGQPGGREQWPQNSDQTQSVVPETDQSTDSSDQAPQDGAAMPQGQNNTSVSSGQEDDAEDQSITEKQDSSDIVTGQEHSTDNADAATPAEQHTQADASAQPSMNEEDGSAQTGVGSNTLILLVASFILMAAGLIYAVRFKGK